MERSKQSQSRKSRGRGFGPSGMDQDGARWAGLGARNVARKGKRTRRKQIDCCACALGLMAPKRKDSEAELPT